MKRNAASSIMLASLVLAAGPQATGEEAGPDVQRPNVVMCHCHDLPPSPTRWT